MAVNGTVRLNIKGKNIEVTPALREYAEKRVAKLNKFFQWREDVLVDVLLSVEKDDRRAEITYRLGGLVMRGESTHRDMYAAIDEASDKLDRQVRRHKNRLSERLHASPRLMEAEAPTDAADNGGPSVVRTKRFLIKPMDLDEAIMQMELLGHDFFVFASAETEEINVLYRRKDGQYGLIEPTMKA